MFIRNEAFVLLLGWASLAAGQSADLAFRQAGNLLGARTGTSGPNYCAGATITPFQDQGGRDRYFLAWTVQTLWQIPEPAIEVISARGILLDSAVKEFERADGLSLDVQVSDLEEGRLEAFRCTASSPLCQPFTPASFPLQGTFTAMTGLGAQTFQTSGNQEMQMIDSFCTTMDSFIGTQESKSARFVGLIGTVTVSVPDPYMSKGQIQRQRGQHRIVRKCAEPVPPPPLP